MGVNRKNRTVALGAMLTALAVALLYAASVIPAARMAITAAAGLSSSVALVRSGRQAAWMTYAASSVLGLIIAPDKLCAAAFAVFFGLYPILKHYIEMLDNLFAEWLLKLIFVNLICTVTVIFFLSLIRLPDAIASGGIPLIYIVCNAAFAVYDIGISRLAALWKTASAAV